MQHDQSQKSKEERVKGESGSAGLDEKPSGQSKEEKKKVQIEFPEGAKRGPVIGMEDERGGVSSFFLCFLFSCTPFLFVDSLILFGGIEEVERTPANNNVQIERFLNPKRSGYSTRM